MAMPKQAPPYVKSSTPGLILIAIGLLNSAAGAQEQFKLDPETNAWKQQARLDPATPGGQLQVMRKILAEGRAVKAKKALDQWIERYPNHPLLVEAYLLRGDAKVERKHYYEALYDYEFLVRRFPGSEQFHTALQREFEIARLFAGGMKRRMWGMRWVSAKGEAEELFIRIQERAPGSLLGEKASLELSDFYFNRSQMPAASEAYDLFLENYPNSQYRERAMLRLIYSSLARFKGPKFDPTGLIDARERIHMYQEEFPAAAEQIGTEGLLQRIEDSLALKMFYRAKWYAITGNQLSAITLYQRLVQTFPGTPASQLAMQRLDELGAPIVPGQEAASAEKSGDGDEGSGHDARDDQGGEAGDDPGVEVQP